MRITYFEVALPQCVVCMTIVVWPKNGTALSG